MLLQLFKDCIEDMVGSISVFFIKVVIINCFLVYIEFFYCVKVDTFLLEL
jgi:hypothetical protein